MKIILVGILMLVTTRIFSQDFYSHSENSVGLNIIYSAKYFVDAESEDPPALYTGQDGNVYIPGTAIFNPYKLTASILNDSAGSSTLILSGIPESIDYSTSNLFVVISTAPKSDYNNSASVVKSGSTIRINVLNSDIERLTQNVFRITLLDKK